MAPRRKKRAKRGNGQTGGFLPQLVVAGLAAKGAKVFGNTDALLDKMGLRDKVRAGLDKSTAGRAIRGLADIGIKHGFGQTGGASGRKRIRM